MQPTSTFERSSKRTRQVRGASARRVLIVLTGSLLALVAFATPALAQAAEKKKHLYRPWSYWIAPILGISFIGMAAMAALGYYLKVVRNPKR